jgi:hypothetical protein
MNLMMLFQIAQFLFAIVEEVHNIEAELPGAPGADKSQAVIDRVTPIANVVGAEVPHIQSIIDSAVGIANASGLFKKKDAPAAVADGGAGSQEAA